MNQLLAQLADENIQYDALLGAVGVNAAFSGKSEEDRAGLICEWMIKRLDGGKDRMDLTYRRIFAEQAGDLVFLDHADLAAHINRDDPNQASHSMTAPCIERLIYHLCSVEPKQDNSEEEVVKKALRSMGQGYESVDALVSEIVSLRKTMWKGCSQTSVLPVNSSPNNAQPSPGPSTSAGASIPPATLSADYSADYKEIASGYFKSIESVADSGFGTRPSPQSSVTEAVNNQTSTTASSKDINDID